MRPTRLALTIPMSAVALLYARWEYRGRGELSVLVLIEEEHLLRTFGESYTDFRRSVPRYLFL
jgi:protein-S-isoprenylcysteine O-methyltransferase Ste14